MKKIFKSLMALMSVVLLVTSCEKSPVKADYDYTFDESQRGFTFAASTQGATYGATYEDSIYSVGVYRNYTEGDEWLPLQYGGDAQYFELPDSIYFEDGKDVSFINIDVRGFNPGETWNIDIAFDGPVMSYCSFDSAALVAKFRKDSLDCIANEDSITAQALGGLIASITSADTITLGGEQVTSVEFVVEFTWVSKGIVKMSSSWEGAEADVAIEEALEYSDAAGNHYMRLNSPYYYIAEDYCTSTGKHAYFYLDKDYNANNSLMPAGIQQVEDDYAWYWHPNHVGVYNMFMNQDNTYAAYVLWAELATGKAYPADGPEIWVWNIDHYNAAKADPNWIYE